jgi:hypothetical protein
LPFRWLRELVYRAAATDIAERSLLIQGATAARALPQGEPIEDLSAREFRIFSQSSEYGIIEWLVARGPVPDTRFIDFVDEDATEAIAGSCWGTGTGKVW